MRSGRGARRAARPAGGIPAAPPANAAPVHDEPGALRAQLDRVEQAVLTSLRQPHPLTLPRGVVGAAYRRSRQTLHIGGDFYDVLRHGEYDSMVVLGDVSGRGVDAAVLTGQVRQALYALRLVERHPRELLRLLNGALLRTGEHQFATLVLGVCTPTATGGLSLTLAGGGHPCPVVLRTDGTVEDVPIGGMPVGAVADAEFADVRVELGPGDVCVLYSDGVVEARGGVTGREPLGHARLVRHLAASAGMPADALAERVAQLATDWLGGRDHDDIAVLAIQAPDVPRAGGRRHLHAVHDTARPAA
ncbi:MAG TPA: PP2C family protein-serine/threonine phosphatase [Micromonosporaceae bacterium]